MDRKIAGMGIGAMLVIGLFTMMGFAFAQDNETVLSTGFVDADGDEVCDNFADGDGDGICDHKGQKEGFVDADGDEVCDNAANCPMHQNGRGCQGGCGRHAAGFTGGCHRAAIE